MKRWQIALSVTLFLLPASLFIFPSCTLVGLLTGVIVEAATPDSISVHSWDVDTLEIGDEIILDMKDGTQVTGVFAGLQRDSLPEYQERFNAYCQAHPFPSRYPKPGDSLTVNVVPGNTYDMVLLAYDVDTLVLQWKKGSRYRIAAKNSPTVEYAQTLVPTPELIQWVRSESVPLLSSLAVRVGPGQTPTSVAIPDIYRISKERSGSPILTGFLVGLSIDAVILAIVAISESSHKSAAPQGQSCPFLYSHNGREYVLDAEVFSGSIVRSLRRTDSVRMGNLTAVDGIARLMIANRLPETQYIDQLSLIAVDNSAGSEVLPGVTGQIRTVSAPQIPFEAKGYDGCIVTKLVAGEDGSSWISNPAGRDPADLTSTRDGLILRFHRTAGATSAKLVLTLRNTHWLTEIEVHLLHLPGYRLQDWYAHMNSSTDARDAFRDILRREAMLRVDIWNKDSWETRGYIPFVGPHVERSLVFPLDLEGVEGDEMRIRMESTPGFWMVNRAQVDFTPDRPARKTPMRIERATDRKGTDLRSLLASLDDTYYVLEQGDEAELEARGMPARPGDHRTYLLVSTGYYTIPVSPEGAPRRSLMAKLANEPGALGSYTTGLFNYWLDGKLGRRTEKSLQGP